MNNEAIKAAIKARGYTVKAFAEVLGVAYGTLRRALAGNQPLTEQLRRHIMLALQASTPAPSGQGVPVSVPLSLPVEVWQAIDAAAASQGISTEKYTGQVLQQLAKAITAGLIQSRHL